jgi:hypothetical protein
MQEPLIVFNLSRITWHVLNLSSGNFVQMDRQPLNVWYFVVGNYLVFSARENLESIAAFSCPAFVV